MKTIQGKEYNYEDILLYNVSNSNIIAIVNDQEQLEQFKATGAANDAPIVKIPFSSETVLEIVKNMKKIKEYNKSDEYIEIIYKDGTTTRVALESENVVKQNLRAQNEVAKERISSSFANMPEEEKKKKKEESSATWKKSLAAVLAALSIYTIGSNKDKIADYASDIFGNNNSEPKKSTQTLGTSQAVKNSQSNQTLNITTERDYEKEHYLEMTTFDFTDLSKRLYEETCNKENFLMKYQQVVNINWDEDLAKIVLEIMNGKYPPSLLNSTDEDAFARKTEALQALSLLISGNINVETRHEDMIDLKYYFLREEDYILVNNAMTIARYAMDETVGEPMNGQILDEGDYASVDKFSREYLGAVDQLLNYELDTINDSQFKKMSSGVRWTVSTIFQQVNNTIPQWSSINRNNQTIYYRDFVNKATGDLYYPVIGQNGTVDYVSRQTGKVYNMYEMFATAGIQLVEEQRNIENYADPNVVMEGIGIEVDNAVLDAKQDIYDLREIAKIYSPEASKTK